MKPFPLLNCPYVAMKKIARHTDEMSHLNLALTSKKTKKHMRMFKKDVEHINISHQNGNWIISVKYLTRIRTDKIDCILWEISTRQFARKRTTDFVRLEGENIENRRQQDISNYIIKSRCENIKTAVNSIVGTMFDVFRQATLVLRTDGLDISKIMKCDIMKEVTDLRILVTEKITDEECCLFWKNARPKKQLICELTNYDNQNNKIETDFVFDIFEIQMAKWFNRQNLLHIKSRSAFIKNTRLTGADMNVFIENWMAGEDTKLESLEIEVNSANTNELLDGIETMSLEEIQIEKKLRNKSFKFSSFNEIRSSREQWEHDGKKGRHLVRRDGKIATVYVHNCQISFNIWTEENPKITHLPMLDDNGYNNNN